MDLQKQPPVRLNAFEGRVDLEDAIFFVAYLGEGEVIELSWTRGRREG